MPPYTHYTEISEFMQVIPKNLHLYSVDINYFVEITVLELPNDLAIFTISFDDKSLLTR